MNNQPKNIIVGIFLLCLIGMLISYANGYSSSIGWEVTTKGDVIKFPALTIDKGLLKHEINADKYLLLESYSGGEIKRNLLLEQVILSISWLGLAAVLVGASFLKRYGFFASIALLALFINRLNLAELGLFGIESKLVLGIPFLALAIPLIYFNEYRKRTSFLIRILTLITISVVLWFGISDTAVFTDHFIAHSLFSFVICGLLFLFIISEEIGFTLLYLVTKGRGGKGNQLHFIALSLFYLGNLTLYYLNKSGFVPNSFFFFDPFILLLISSLVALWSLKFKFDYLVRYVSGNIFLIITFGLGLIFISFLGLSMVKGNDPIYQAFHYLVLYFHLGFGAFFLLYIISNFIDPLIGGLEIYKIAYKERNFPYASARLGGFAVILGFYFLSGQEAYNLLRSGYYNGLGDIELTKKNTSLAKEYYKQADFLGYSNHYSNYKLGWLNLNAGKEFQAKVRFERAGSRYPSPFALVNYGNIDSELNANKVQARLEQGLTEFNSGELKNNLGILQMQKQNIDQALVHFEEAESSNTWNQAPLLNKWNVFKLKEIVDSTRLVSDFENGNFGVRANLLTTQIKGNSLSFDYNAIEKAIPLHRQAYLLNSAYLFSNDSLESLINNEIDNSTNANLNNRLRKALAVYYYQKREINKAFKMMDYLQANAYIAYQGDYLSDLGKLALDQGAFQLALDYFDKAIEVKHLPAQINRLEVLLAMGKHDEVEKSLLDIIQKDPGMTEFANDFLAKSKSYQFVANISPTVDLTEMSTSDIERLARENSFDETSVLRAIAELNKREEFAAYEILVDAIEINPYSVEILKEYVLVAANWNFENYANDVLKRLAPLLSEKDYQAFKNIYESRTKEAVSEPWQ
ncbi:MAG: hypothetical protein AB8B73_15580 [Ekhidna sp.]